MTYDSNHNLLTRTAPAPLSYQEQWTYDALNDVLSYKDGRGSTTGFGYDGAGNLTSQTGPDHLRFLHRRHGLAPAAVVLFFISVGTCRLEYVACTSNPSTAWMTQQARNLLMELDDRQRRALFLIHDRDKKFSRAFDGIFQSEGITIIRTPIQAPNANAYSERWVGSVRRDCLDRLLIFSRRQLERVLQVYVHHYNQHRPHRALELRPPNADARAAPPRPAMLGARQVQRRDLLGGLLHEYEAVA